MAFTYDNQFGPNNVYGHSIELLQKIVQTGDTDAVHLDVGCGFGPIADSIKGMGLHYVGVDLDEDGLGRLRKRGFEAHRLELSNADDTYQALSDVLAGRRLASITILDTLEHVLSPLDAMQALRRLASIDNVPIVLSVPNVAHTEIAARLVTGKFDYTLDGVLDHTHIVNFSKTTLQRMTRQAGLMEVQAFDTKIIESYRDMHASKDALPLHSSFYQLVSHIRETVDETATSYQLVRAFLPGPEHTDEPWYVEPSKDPERPLLSIVMRTTGAETFSLCDTLTCLSGQRDLDFEILLIGHKLGQSEQIAVETVLQHQPDYLRKRINFTIVKEGGRARPLNVAYRMANGRYIVTLDDDDLVFGNYVEVFRALHEKQPGRLLRARCGAQPARKSNVKGAKRTGAISTGGVDSKYPADFKILDHLSDNYTPCMSVAYPREVIHTFGLEFDETLSTAEDWDFMMRSYFLLGIETSPDITSVYRLWEGKATSAQLHTQDEWLANRETILQKHNALPVILPPGALKELCLAYEGTQNNGTKAEVLPVAPSIRARAAHLRFRLGTLKARVLHKLR